MGSVAGVIAGTGHSPVVDPNLLMWLDASYYSGSGTAWNNILTGSSSFNTTLVGTPTYSTANSGYLTLNGSTQYASVTGSTTAINTCTMVMWIYSAAAQASYTGLLYNRVIAPNIMGMNYNALTGNLGWTWSDDVTTYNYNTGLAIPNTTWTMLAVSVGTASTTFYVNGSTNTQTYAAAANTFTAITIGQDNLGSRLFNGRIGVVMLYNRTLSVAELNQNYNAYRGRYSV